MTETIPKKEICKKAKWLSEGASQTAQERREVESKGERERYTLLNAELPRTARREKKESVSDTHATLSSSLRPHGLSMGLSRPESWSGQPFPSPGDLPNPGIEPRSPASQVDSLPAELSGKPDREEGLLKSTMQINRKKKNN